MLPDVHNKALVFESFQERIQSAALNPRKTMPPEDFCNGIAMVLPMAQHREHRLRERRPRQLLVKVEIFHL